MTSCLLHLFDPKGGDDIYQIRIHADVVTVPDAEIEQVGQDLSLILWIWLFN